LPSTRFLNEIGNGPDPAASWPSRLPFRSYICWPTRRAILALSRQTPPFRTTARIFPVSGSRMTSWAKMKSWVIGFSSKTTGRGQSLWLRHVTAAVLKTYSWPESSSRGGLIVAVRSVGLFALALLSKSSHRPPLPDDEKLTPASPRDVNVLSLALRAAGHSSERKRPKSGKRGRRAACRAP
jgi:hypothetical protein